jgi:hypothetical protein
MKVIITADINSNKIYVNNLYDIKFTGKIVIEYFNTILYENELTLPENQIFWFSPYLKMNDISNIKVTLLEKDNTIFDSVTPLIYVSFMRAESSELNNMCDFIKSNGNIVTNIVEIGAFQGESTTIFSKNFPNSNIFAVDFWINNYDDREVNINSYNMIDVENNFNILTKYYPNIIKIKMLSSEFSNIISDNSIDFIYIDGDHSYNGVNSDIMSWKNKIKPNGFIGGHDYNEKQAGTVVRAVSENFPNSKIDIFGPSWLIKIK